MSCFKSYKASVINIGVALLGIGVILNGPACEIFSFLKPSIITVIIS